MKGIKEMRSVTKKLTKALSVIIGGVMLSTPANAMMSGTRGQQNQEQGLTLNMLVVGREGSLPPLRLRTFYSLEPTENGGIRFRGRVRGSEVELVCNRGGSVIGVCNDQRIRHVLNHPQSILTDPRYQNFMTDPSTSSLFHDIMMATAFGRTVTSGGVVFV